MPQKEESGSESGRDLAVAEDEKARPGTRSVEHEDEQEEISEGELRSTRQTARKRGKTASKAAARQARRATKRRATQIEAEDPTYKAGSKPSSERNREIVHANQFIDSKIETITHADGSTSRYFDKRKLKIAPRSTLQFKVGPSFTDAARYCKIRETKSDRDILVTLRPRIDRGFDLIDNEWIGYKRNYFTLVTSFNVEGMELAEFLKGSYNVLGVSGASKPLAVKYFAVRLLAVCTEDGSDVSLVQHTAKRDKGPQFEPPVLALVPAELPSHQIIREASNVRNESKMRKYDSLFFYNREGDLEETGEEDARPRGIVASYLKDRIKKVARYERVQFSSSINAKKQPQQCKYFKLRVVLGCVVEGVHLGRSGQCQYAGLDCLVENGTRTFVPVMEMETPPLVIRGRSPSNYSAAAVTSSPCRQEGGKRFTTPSNTGHKKDSQSPTATKTSRTVFRTSAFQGRAGKGPPKIRDITNKYESTSDALEKTNGTTLLQENHLGKSLSPALRPSGERTKLQTMSCIEAVMRRHLPHILQSGVTIQGLNAMPKTCEESATVGMRDIELAPYRRLSSQDCQMHNPLNAFENDNFGLGMSPEPHQHNTPRSMSTIRNPFAPSRVPRERKLNNKMVSMDLSILDKLSTGANEDSTEMSFSEASYYHQAGYSTKDIHTSANVPRSIYANPMDISFCLNLNSDANTVQRPASKRRAVSRRALASNAKPSDIFGASELFDEPSFYRH